MDWFVKAFIRASLIWLALGVGLGVAIAANPAWGIYRQAHAHLTAVGWITMMVFGVGYQLLPRLFGGQLHSRAVAGLHVWIANVGLALMVAGFCLAPHLGARGTPVTAAGGTLFAVGALLFVYNMWRTFEAADRRRMQLMMQSPRKLTTLD